MRNIAAGEEILVSYDTNRSIAECHSNIAPQDMGKIMLICFIMTPAGSKVNVCMGAKNDGHTIA